MIDEQHNPCEEKSAQRRVDNLLLFIAETRQLLAGAQRAIDESEAVLQLVAEERGDSAAA
jgi:hypothetical protein